MCKKTNWCEVNLTLSVPSTSYSCPILFVPSIAPIVSLYRIIIRVRISVRYRDESSIRSSWAGVPSEVTGQCHRKKIFSIREVSNDCLSDSTCLQNACGCNSNTDRCSRKRWRALPWTPRPWVALGRDDYEWWSSSAWCSAPVFCKLLN